VFFLPYFLKVTVTTNSNQSMNDNQAPEDGQQAPQEQVPVIEHLSEPAKSNAPVILGVLALLLVLGVVAVYLFFQTSKNSSAPQEAVTTNTEDTKEIGGDINTELIDNLPFHARLEGATPQRLESNEVLVPRPESEITETNSDRFANVVVPGVYLERTTDFELPIPVVDYNYDELLAIHGYYETELKSQGYMQSGVFDGGNISISYFQKEIDGKIQVIELATGMNFPASGCPIDFQDISPSTCSYTGETVSLFISDPFDPVAVLNKRFGV